MASKAVSRSPARDRSVRSGRSKSSGQGSAKVTKRRVNAGGQEILSKSSKDLQANIQAESDLTNRLRPALQNVLRKGEGMGGGAKPTVDKDKSLYIEPV